MTDVEKLFEKLGQWGITRPASPAPPTAEQLRRREARMAEKDAQTAYWAIGMDAKVQESKGVFFRGKIVACEADRKHGGFKTTVEAKNGFQRTFLLKSVPNPKRIY